MNQEKSLKMRNMPVGKLIATMSIPAMFSMLIQALYNIIDSYWVGKIDLNNDDMITAIGYAFPIQIITFAFALGIGIGTNVLVARKLGERKPSEASQIALTGFIMAFVTGITFFLLSFVAIGPFMNFMSDKENIIIQGTIYLRIVTMFSIFLFIEIIANKVLQGMGRMIIPMFTQIIGAVTNIILDPILIFGYFGLPAMGIQGAAIATIISQALAMTFAITYILFTKFEIKLSFKNFKFKFKFVMDILLVGLPAMAMNALGAITNIIFNNILKRIDPQETANAVLTSYFKLQSFFFMPVFGINQGGMPILSYNYGANNKERYLKALKIMMITSLVIMTFGFVVFQLYPSQLLGFFNPSERMLEIGVRALRIISISFIPVSISVIIIMAFQSLGRGEIALIVTLLRQAFLLIPLTLFLGNLGGLRIVWYSIPISETIVAMIFLPLILILVKKSFEKKAILQKLNNEVN